MSTKIINNIEVSLDFPSSLEIEIQEPYELNIEFEEFKFFSMSNPYYGEYTITKI